VFHLNRVQRACLDTVPASHAHILKHNRWFKGPVYLFHHLVRADGCRRAFAFIPITLFWVADGVIHHCEWFFRLHNCCVAFTSFFIAAYRRIRPAYRVKSLEGTLSGCLKSWGDSLTIRRENVKLFLSNESCAVRPHGGTA